METSFAPLQVSLAQWSLHRAFFDKNLDPNLFASIARNDYDIEAVEYVNQFYLENAKDERFWIDLKRHADDHDVKSLLIMVDDEGDLGNPDDEARMQAVDNHEKWINAAKLLGCHSIRVNAFGDGSQDEVRAALVDGMGALVTNAAREGINVLIENHGLYSSDAKWVIGIIDEVRMDNFGTLPDFGNWFMSAKWGSTQIPCEEVYGIYKGVQDFLPYAKGVSAKSYDFTEDGNQSKIDYRKMLEMIRNSKFEDYIGIEYEGENLSESEGIEATKALLERTWASIHF